MRPKPWGHVSFLFPIIHPCIRVVPGFKSEMQTEVTSWVCNLGSHTQKDLTLDLMPYCCHLEITNNVIFALVFCDEVPWFNGVCMWTEDTHDIHVCY